MTTSRRVIGLFGGTFDPIHHGHLRMALELRQQLPFDEMRLVPCHRPAHRESPLCSSEDRAQMVHLAVAEEPLLSVDERELRADRPSFTVDTLAQLRAEFGTETSLCWCVGMDSLVNLHTWSRWQQLLHYGHLVVVGRPGWSLPEQGIIGQWLQEHLALNTQVLCSAAAGSVVVVEQSMLDVSATQIRRQVAAGYSAQYLLPQPVWRYIQERGLYLAPAPQLKN